MLKGILIGEDLTSFLNEHPEIKIKRNSNKIISITIPEDLQITSLYIKDSQLYNLEYIYNGEFCRFSV